MSGICGIVFNDRNERVGTDSLMTMLRATDRTAEREVFSATLGATGLGVQRFRGGMAGIAEEALHGQRSALAFQGDIYNLGELFPSGEKGSNPIDGMLRLYLKEGMAFLKRIHGEFALALWDGSRETLYLATDRFRMHPLFYYLDQNKIIFASRIKSIQACPFSAQLTIRPEAIIDAVASSFIPTPATIFQEVKKLPPGAVLIYQSGRATIEPYWNMNFLTPSRQSEQALSSETRKLFRGGMEARLKADGLSDRIGTFLSGGIDSTTVLGVLTELTGHPIKTFSIGFDETRFNEIDYARIAARAFGAEHYEYFVSAKDTYDAIPILLENFDEPYANASSVPTYFCAKLAREQGVDFLYAGDGGDELFAGNERYATQRLFDYYQRIPVWFRKPLLEPLIFALAKGLKRDLWLKGKKYIQRANIPYPERLTSYGFFNVIPMREFFEEGFLRRVEKGYDSSASVRSHYLQAPARHELDKQLYLDLKLAISDNDLFKVTRMTQAADVAVRFPFLDHRFAEFAGTIPAEMKMRGRKLRSFFKETYADLLPLETRTKTKHGFGLPIPVWLRTDKRLNEMMLDLVLAPQSIQRGYFRKESLEKIVACHRTDETSFYGSALWNLMMLELWHRNQK
jgi:asparagine synthase (glutamine-hydrolysing)